MGTLEMLLKADKEKFKVADKKINIKRLSEELGEEVVFTIKHLSLDKINEIRESNSEDVTVHMVIEAVKEPSFKSKELMEKYDAITPVDLINKILLPGEIEEIYILLSKMNGYRKETIEEIKKK